MKPNSTRMDQLFHLLRTTSPGPAPFGPDEIRALLNGKGANTAANSVPGGRRRAAVWITVLASLAIGGTSLLLLQSPDQSAPMAGGVAPHATPTKATAAQRTAAQQVPAAAAGRADRPSESGTAQSLIVPTELAPATTKFSSANVYVRNGASRRRGSDVVQIQGAGNGGTMRRGTRMAANQAGTHDSTTSERAIAPERPVPPAPRSIGDISGIGALELTPAELQRLNVQFDGQRLVAYAQERYATHDKRRAERLAQIGVDMSQSTALIGKRIEINGNDANVEWLRYSASDTLSTVAPIIVTHSWIRAPKRAGSTLIYFDNSPLIDMAGIPQERLNAALQEETNAAARQTFEAHAAPSSRLGRMLVPVYIRMVGTRPEQDAERADGDIFLWYYPTPEFVAALPDRYRKPLLRELNAIADVQECHLPTTEVCRQLTGEPSILGYCSSSSGALTDATLYPNPAHGHASLRFTLAAERNVSVALHNLRGAHLRDLIRPILADRGVHTIELPLAETSNGIYLVVISTDHGERATQRLIVQ